MLKIDMWYGYEETEADKILGHFHDFDRVYRGNIYKEGKCIGNYSCNNPVELEKAFPQLNFNNIIKRMMTSYAVHKSNLNEFDEIEIENDSGYQYHK